MAKVEKNPKIVALLASAQDETQVASKICAVVDQITVILLSENLAYYMQIPCRKVGVHPKNRDGYGVSGINSQHIGLHIFKLGFSWKACKDATCFEDGPEKEIELAKNDDLLRVQCCRSHGDLNFGL